MRLLVVVLILPLAAPALVSGATIHVPGDQPTIQAGINATSAGDTVLVAAGTYSGVGNCDIDFGGRGIAVASEAGPGATTVDCQGGGGAYHRGFFFHSGEGPASILDGFTVINGWEVWHGGYGGGIFCTDASSPTIRNCVLRGNSANDGGGMFCDRASSPTVTGCLFQENWADVYGGGLYCWHGSSPAVVGCVFQRNGGSEHGGGLVLSEESCPTLTNCTFYGNWAGIDGGCVAVLFGSLPATLIGTILSYSTMGRAVFCNSSVTPPILQCCDVYGNAGGDWVGCIADQYGVNGNISEDPLFCDATGGNLYLDCRSPCAPAQQPECGLIGAYDVGCGASVSLPSTWGQVKSLYR